MSDEDKLSFLKMTKDKQSDNITKAKKIIKDTNTNSVYELADFNKANTYILTSKPQQAEFSRCK